MNLRNLLLSFAAIAASPLFAATYYVSPNGAGEKDGSSWDNALDTEGFQAKAASNENGDIYNFAGGVYQPSTHIIFKTGAILNGNSDGQRSIFSGDKDNNNNPDDGDMNRLIRFEAKSQNVEINNLDFTCVYTNSSDAALSVGALMIEASTNVKINGCRFYGNWSNGTQGGAPCHLNASIVKFTECIFSNNSANYRGAAIRIKSNVNKTGYTTFEKCVFKNNTNYHNMGIIFVSHSMEVNLINCILSGNESKGTSNASTIFINTPNTNYENQLTIINSTIAGNTPSQIGFNGKGANLRMVNSMITGSESTDAIDFNADEDFVNVKSGGYNYVGPISVGEFWQDTDNHGTDCTYASIFGDNTLNNNNQLIPVQYIAGASGDQVKAATEEWGLPDDLSLTTDAAGNIRAAGMTPGANSFTEAQIKDFTTSVITVINDAENTPHLVKVANSVYTVEGTTEGITVYTVNGATVAATSSNTVDLSSFANGLYILKSGNAIFKIMK